ncbi:hypothetical protein G9A89_001947 [Geosiphon pyriformis]|nr:hypothetical protein G9A89_001947 [Geosiphon pyriformis]
MSTTNATTLLNKIPFQSKQKKTDLLVTPEDTTPNKPEPNQKQPLINNILSATIINDDLLAAIFPFKLETQMETPFFSGAALNKKSIMIMYTNVKVNRQTIKLILNSGLAGSIITQQLMN